MKAKTKNKLFEAWAYADMEDKSTEWMIAYMQDFAQVDHDTVTDFIFNEGKNRSQWYKENPNWFMKYESISENQLRALEIIHNHKTSISGLEFAKAMWPDSNMHNHKIGKIVRNGHSYIFKLIRRGWVRKDERPFRYQTFELTIQGLKILMKAHENSNS